MKLWNTSTFWGRVKQKADFKGIYLKDLAEQIGMSQSTIFNLISSDKIPKKPGMVEKMAALLGTTVEYLIEGKESKESEGPTEEEKKCLFYFQSMNEEDRQLVLNLMRRLIY